LRQQQQSVFSFSFFFSFVQVKAASAMMKSVRLMTKDGGFVAGGKIPIFNEPPDVVGWGQRIFTYSHTDDETVDVYIEAFSVALALVD
jgi:hypothetical protein